MFAAIITDPPCRIKTNRPPSDRARHQAANLVAGFGDDEVVVSHCLPIPCGGQG